MKKKLIYIFPDKTKKTIDFDKLVRSLKNDFELLVLVKSHQGVKCNDVFCVKDFVNEKMDEEFLDKFPFSVIGVDRHAADYSNIGSVIRPFKKDDYKNTLYFFKYHFEHFEPDYVISHTSDNSFSHMATLLAKEFNVPCFVELLRPYWPTRQILVDPFTHDSSQIKKLANIYAQIPLIDSKIERHGHKEFDHKSPYWTANFPSIRTMLRWNNIPKLLNFHSYKNLVRKMYLFYVSRSKVMTEKYIIFPLHLQPESVLLATDNRFSDQAQLSEFISYNIGLDWSLVVKEHPAQNFRPIGFYRKISKLPNAYFLYKGSSTKDLVRDSNIVFCISGNVGYEAVLAGKKVILVGDAYYSGFPNVHKYEYNMRLDVFIRKVIEAETIDIDFVKHYSDCYSKALYDVSINVSSEDLHNNVVSTAGTRLKDLFRLYEDSCKYDAL